MTKSAKRGRPSTPRAGAPDPELLVGWQRIADFLGQPANTVQRWAKQGMPYKKSGRNVASSANELLAWLGHVSGTKLPVHLPDPSTDLAAELRRGLQEARARGRRR